MRVSAISFAAFALAGCSSPSAVDTGDTDTPDLPEETHCGDGEVTAGELCFSAVATPIPLRGIHAGDMNGDGYSDLVAFGLQGVDIHASLWRNDGTGTFSSASEKTLSGTVGSIPNLARFDQNPTYDIVAFELAPSEGGVRVFLSDGQWGVAAPVDVLVEGAGEPWNTVVVADVDADGLDDMLAEPYMSSESLFVLRNTGGALEVSPKSIESAPNCWYSNSAQVPAFSGFTGGVIFIPGECTGVTTSMVSLVLAQVGGEIIGTTALTTGSSPAAAAAGDFDGDGAIEVLVWDRSLQAFDLYRATFVGALEPLTTMTLTELCPECENLPEATVNMRIDAAQFDGNAASDLMISFGDSLYFGLNPLTDTGSWSQWPTTASIKAQLVLDINNDSIDDAIFSDDVTYVLHNRH